MFFCVISMLGRHSTSAMGRVSEKESLQGGEKKKSVIVDDEDGMYGVMCSMLLCIDAINTMGLTECDCGSYSSTAILSEEEDGVLSAVEAAMAAARSSSSLCPERSRFLRCGGGTGTWAAW